MSAGAPPPDVAERERATAQSPASHVAGTGRRVLLLAGRAEAGRLVRGPLVLAGLIISTASIWLSNSRQVPLWWAADVGVGTALLVVAGTVLIAAHLAAGRARRDAMRQLYDSYPASAGARTGGLLLGVAGPAALAAAVVGGAVLWLDSQGAVGSPRFAVLAGGVLLVVLGGTLGVALGSWLPQPMVGILAAVVLGLIETDLVLGFGGWANLSGLSIWLFPWTENRSVLSSLPEGVIPVMPTTHAAELAGLIGLAATAALLRVLPRRLLVAVVAVVCLAVTGWSGWAQARPVPLSRLSRLAYQVAHPAQAEQCVTEQQVRYCYYPAFRPMVPRWAAAVNGVLTLLPRQANRVLIVRQVVDDLEFGPPLTDPGGHSAPDQQIRHLEEVASGFEDAEATNQDLVPGSSNPPVYTDLIWGSGRALGPSQLGLALSTAYSLAGLPTTQQIVYLHNSTVSGRFLVSCLPVSQAREAVALWLAASATPLTRAAFDASPGIPSDVQVAKHWISAEDETGSGPALNLEATGQAVALARAMLALPARRVESVLAGRWPGWLSPEATDAQLAAALGIALPKAAGTPPASGPVPGGSGPVVTSLPPASPVCR